MSNEMLKARLCAPVGLNDCIGVSQLQLAAAHAAGVIDLQRDEIAALKTHASKGDEEIEKLSPLVEIVSNQKQRIQQMEEQLAAAKAEIAEITELLDMVCGCYDSEEISHHFCIDGESAFKITETLAKHKESKWD